jgi:hypothetical protein
MRQVGLAVKGRLCAALALALACLSAVPSMALAKKHRPARGYAVGIAARSINPDADGTFQGKPVYLGGYGIGGGSPLLKGRPATGILGPGVQVRAFVVSARGRSFAIADIEAQGWFVADKDGPYGLMDIRKAVERRTGGALRATSVVVQSDHSHSGADALGVWGGVPKEYRQFVVNQTIDAIADAYAKRRAGRLYYGTAPGADLLSNQFSYDEANKVLDSDVRVLQARDKRGKPFATLLDFSAHATVLGSSNTKISGDWIAAANPQLEQRFGGRAMTVVGTLGRTQPGDRGCSDPTATTPEASDLCKLHDYAARVVGRAADAAKTAKPLSGRPVVGARSYLIADPSTNAPILGLEYAGAAVGVPLNRANTPPWFTGNVVGTVTATARIGDVLLSSGPGEMYPQIPLKVRALAPGLRGYMTAGLANDQLGYLIAPYEAYPEPVRRSFFNERGDEVSPVDNDNYFFNVSHTMGERVTCSLLRGVGDLFGGDPRSKYDRCGAFANDMVLPAGFDTGF